MPIRTFVNPLHPRKDRNTSSRVRIYTTIDKMILREKGACTKARYLGGCSTQIWVGTRYTTTDSTTSPRSFQSIYYLVCGLFQQPQLSEQSDYTLNFLDLPLISVNLRPYHELRTGVRMLSL